MKLEIKTVPIDEIRTYANNAKIHTAEQIEEIKLSIEEFGFLDPVATWHGELVEGHGRLIAAKEMGFTELPVIPLDGLTEEQRRAYMLVHNKLTMNTGFDLDILQEELENISGIEMEQFGFDEFDIHDALDEEEFGLEKYTSKVKIPQYEIVGDLPDIEEMVDTTKRDLLIKEIENTDGIDEDVKQFLIDAAHRHTVFNYKKIAEFYAHQDKPVQELMEKSALVIIDVNDAIANGYLRLTKTMEDLLTDGDSYEE